LEQTIKLKLQVKMLSVSDDDVRKRVLEKPRFGLKMYSNWEDVTIVAEKYSRRKRRLKSLIPATVVQFATTFFGDYAIHRNRRL